MSDKINARDLRAAARQALCNESQTLFARQPDSESGKTRFSSTPAGQIDDKSNRNNIDTVRPIENLDSFVLNTPARQRKQDKLDNTLDTNNLSPFVLSLPSYQRKCHHERLLREQLSRFITSFSSKCVVRTSKCCKNII